MPPTKFQSSLYAAGPMVVRRRAVFFPSFVMTLAVNKYFELKELVGHRGTPELKLLAVVILFTPILHETITNSNFDTSTIR